jgi:formate dehydrogenase accessory protein FdhD
MSARAGTDAAGPFPGLGHAAATRRLPLVHLSDAQPTAGDSSVVEEVPVAFVFNGHAHAVMMATPSDLEDLAVGFVLSEQIVGAAQDITRVDVERHSRGIELRVGIPEDAAARLAERSRVLAGRTGCGLCGVDAIDDAVRAQRPVGSRVTVCREALWRASEALDRLQPLNREAHALHAAAWADPEGCVHVAREDVGRHNALDKVLGALARDARSAADGFVLVTSRASFELVQKAAACGVPLVAAVSRPTALAIRMADATGICLVGLLRGRSANVYAHPERITD